MSMAIALSTMVFHILLKEDHTPETYVFFKKDFTLLDISNRISPHQLSEHIWDLVDFLIRSHKNHSQDT